MDDVLRAWAISQGADWGFIKKLSPGSSTVFLRSYCPLRSSGNSFTGQAIFNCEEAAK